jgi:hypothetical protein
MGNQRFIPHPRRVLPRTSCSLWGIANECGSVLAISRVSNGSICFGLSQFTVLVRSSAQGQLRRIPVSHTTSKLANLTSSVPSLPISSCSSSCSLACLNCASKEWACFLWDGSCGNRSGGDSCWVCRSQFADVFSVHKGIIWLSIATVAGALPAVCPVFLQLFFLHTRRFLHRRSSFPWT